MVRLEPVSSRNVAGFPFTFPSIKIMAWTVRNGTRTVVERARLGGGSSRRTINAMTRGTRLVDARFWTCETRRAPMIRTAAKMAGIAAEVRLSAELRNVVK